MKTKTTLLMCFVLMLTLIVGCTQTPQGDVSISSMLPANSALPTVAVTLCGDEHVVIEAGEEYLEWGAISEDNSAIIIKGAVDTSRAGRYVLSYTSHTPGAAVVDRVVEVTDHKPPVITLNGSKSVTVSSEKMYKDQGVKVTDLGDPNVKVTTQRSQLKDGKFTVTYTATDLSGNTAQMKRTVTVKDIVKPVIKLTGSAELYVERDGKYTDEGFTATDDLDGNVTGRVKVEGKVDTSVCGLYVLTYTVADKAGNITAVKRTVHVYSQQADCPDRVYLTFDDGPNSTVTPKVLDALKRNNVKATFFIINYPDSRKDIVKRIVDEGHTLAIHTYNHDYSVCYASDAAYMQGLKNMHDKILADTGYDAKIIRFPGGTSNAVSKNYNRGIMTRLSKKVTESGYIYFDWNVDSGDAAGSNVSSKTIYNNVVKGLRRNRNNVVLMHDAGGKGTTAAALDNIISYCKKNGYAVLPITEETLPVRHKPTN